MVEEEPVVAQSAKAAVAKDLGAEAMEVAVQEAEELVAVLAVELVMVSMVVLCTQSCKRCPATQPECGSPQALSRAVLCAGPRVCPSTGRS